MEIRNHDIQFFTTRLDAAAAVARVASPEAGAIDVFIGITRATTHPAHGQLIQLDYHAYNEMALSEMRKIAGAAAQQWPIARLVLWHRLGLVPIGEASVVIAVSSAHRQAAFAACRFLIDSLKQTVPIWKKEVFARSTRWQGEHEVSSGFSSP